MYTLAFLFIIGWAWLIYDAIFNTKTIDSTDETF